MNIERSARTEYRDIIDLPHHRSKTHRAMSMEERAAQFSPFAALSGYEEMVEEEERHTEEMTEPEDWIRDEIGRRLERISAQIREGRHPVAEITYFVPDERKAGGAYVTVREAIRQIDPVYQKIILMRTTEIGHVNLTIEFDRVSALRLEEEI